MFAIPLAWLQLQRERIRLLVALAGIGFAVILMFLQLGFQDALFDSAVTLHASFKGDIFLVSPESTSLISMRTFSDRRLYQVLGFEGVESVTPVYVGFGNWKNPFWTGLPQNPTRQIMVIGIVPGDDVFALPEVAESTSQLRLADVVIFDRASRSEFGPIPSKFEELNPQGKSITTEISDRRVTVGGLFKLGASFGADGNLITSDLNFLRIFPRREKDKIDVGMIKLKPEADLAFTLKQLKQGLPGQLRTNPALSPQEAKEDFIVGDVRILSKQAFMALERNYWAESTAIGFIFTLGAAIGFVVGTVIVYQILYTDVTDHLAEYATLKAMGYRGRYLSSVVFQEAVILSVLGYIPGFLLSNGLYSLTRNATSLPIAMTLHRAVIVLFLALVMCLASGLIAVRKVQDADPADIF